MSARSSDPASRRLRNFVLLVIFAVAVPSLVLTGFGLIAINNERDAALKRIHGLYKSTTTRLENRIQQRLKNLLSDSREPLRQLVSFARREVAHPGEIFATFREQYGEAANFFVLGDSCKCKLLLPRPEAPLPTWQGYLPEAFENGRSLEFVKNLPGEAAKIYLRLLESMPGEDPVRCPLLNALSRSLVHADRGGPAAPVLEELVNHCDGYIDSAGYNLSMGARLQWLRILDSVDPDRFDKEMANLADALSDPTLAISRPQSRFVARKAASMIQAGRSASLDISLQRLQSISIHSEILAALGGVAEQVGERRTLITVRAAGRRQLLLVQGGEVLTGFLIDPAALRPFLQEVLSEMEVDGELVARIRSSEEPLPEEEGSGVSAGMVFLKETDLAWRLDVILLDSEAIDSLAETRTRLYFWALLVVVAALVLGIGRTVQVMVREARLSRLKTDFVSSVSHELRTPLTSIRMFTETLLLNRVSSKEQERECLETIGRETERLSRLVERILDFSRMEAGRKAFRFQPERLDHLVDLALAACRPMIEAEGFDVQRSLPEGLPDIDVDRDAIVEVLINLLSNAIKYSPVERRVEIWARSDSGFVEFGVTDQGIGIARSDQKRVFEKFYRVDTPMAAEIPGSGLGLSLVQYIVHAHDGEILLASSLGTGTKFTIRLPLKRSDREESASRAEENEA